MVKRVLTLALSLVLYFGHVAMAEDESRLNLADKDPAVKTVLLEALVGSRVKLRLQGDVVLIGALSGLKDADCIFQVEGEKDARTFAITAIRSVEHFATVPKTDTPKSAPTMTELLERAVNDGIVRRIALSSGKSYRGRVIASDGKSVKVELSDGITVEIPRPKIESVAAGDARIERRERRARRKRQRRRRQQGYMTEDPNRTRYLFAPSAKMLRKGDGYFSQKQLGFSEIAYGVHENVTIVAGGIVPAWLIAPPVGFNLSLGAKFGLEIAENLQWAAGVYGLVIPGFGGDALSGGGFVFTTLTGGNERYHGSVTVGVPFIFGDDDDFFDPIIVLAGNIRVSDGLALVSENWLFPSLLVDDADEGSVHSLALRFITDEFATDVGLVHIPGMGDDVPLLPWLDFTYNWGASY